MADQKMNLTLSRNRIPALALMAFPVMLWSAEPAPPATATGQPAAAAAADASRTLTLSLEQAILMALAHNQSLKVEQLNTPIQRTNEAQELAAFDPVLSASLARSVVRGQSSPAPGDTVQERDFAVTEVQAGVSKLYAAGTTVAVDAQFQNQSEPGTADLASMRFGVTVTQPLLQGRGTRPNLARLQEARLDSLLSEYEFRGFSEALVAAVEQGYWNHLLNLRSLQIYLQSVQLAERQLEETRQRIAVGTIAPSEQVAAEAEVALRREALINAQSVLELSRIALIRLLNPGGPGAWTREIDPQEHPELPALETETPEVHIAVAFRQRPEMNQARLLLRRGDLEIVRTRNGLLPKLDLFVTLGPTAYASSFPNMFEQFDTNHYDAAAGLLLTYPLGKRRETAQFQRAQLTQEQAKEALANLAQLVEVDIRTALVEIQRSREQTTATAASRRLREETLRVETEKQRIGKSTSLLVAQTQRDLLTSQVAEIAAWVNARKALTRFFLAQGSLLEHRGIDAPGRQPIEPDDRGY